MRPFRTAPPTARVVVRWCAAHYLVVVGIVYWALLAPLGAADGVPGPYPFLNPAQGYDVVAGWVALVAGAFAAAAALPRPGLRAHAGTTRPSAGSAS